jgi:hypothetical protein
VDGSPSSESLLPAVTTPAGVSPSTSSTFPTSGVASSTAAVSASSIEEPEGRLPSRLISEQASSPTVRSVRSESINSDGEIHDLSSRLPPGFVLHPIDPPTFIPSVTAGLPKPPTGFSDQLSRSQLNNASGFVRSSSSNLSAPAPSTDTASSPQGLQPVNKAFTDPGLTAVTPSMSSVCREKSASKSLRTSCGVGGDFKVVSKTELDDDDEFDVVDNEGPSAANGTTKTSYVVAEEGLDVGWEDDE